LVSNDREPSESPERDTDGFLMPFGVEVDPELLQLALTHRTCAYEHRVSLHNERLVFLGDSVLGQAVTAKLSRDFPELNEGDLANRRAALVSTIALAEIARGLGLGSFLKLGKGERQTGGRNKDSILADTVEAVIGAVFLSVDAATAERFVLDLVAPLFADPERFTETLDPKTRLQKIAAERGLPHPPYETEGTGPDHDRRYTSSVTLDGVTGAGSGTSKKAAELAAARDAVEQLRSKRRRR